MGFLVETTFVQQSMWISLLEKLFNLQSGPVFKVLPFEEG